MDDESHDSKLTKAEEIVGAAKPTLVDCTETWPDPGNSIYPHVPDANENPKFDAL